MLRLFDHSTIGDRILARLFRQRPHRLFILPILERFRHAQLDSGIHGLWIKRSFRLSTLDFADILALMRRLYDPIRHRLLDDASIGNRTPEVLSSNDRHGDH